MTGSIFRKGQKADIIYVKAHTPSAKNTALGFVLQFFLVYLTFFGFVGCVASSTKMTISTLQIGFICFVFLLIASLLVLYKRVLFPALGLIALIIFIFQMTSNIISQVCNAFLFCYNYLITIMYEQGYDYMSYSTMNIGEILSDPMLMNRYFLCVIIVVSFVYSFIFALSLYKRVFVWICALPCFILLVPAFYFGAVPDLLIFALFLSGLLGLYVQNLFEGQMIKINKSAKSTKSLIKKLEACTLASVYGLITSLVILIVSVITVFAVSSGKVIEISGVRQKLDDISNMVINRLFYSHFDSAEGAVGGLLEGDSLSFSAPQFRNLPIMDVTTNTNEGVYLRGWIAKDLNEEGWTVLDEQYNQQYLDKVGNGFDQTTQFMDFLSSVYGDKINAELSIDETKKYGFVFDNVNIKAHFNKSSMLFMPSNSSNGVISGDYEGIEKLGDTILFFKNGRPENNQYSVNAALLSIRNQAFYQNFDNMIQNYLKTAQSITEITDQSAKREKFMYNERRYANFVRENYLQQNDWMNFLQPLIKSITDPSQSDLYNCFRIEEYFRTSYMYNLSPRTVSGGISDKIEYMINISREGYCTYFATAMVSMLRQMDIPSRLVIGYYSQRQLESDGKFVRTLYDKNYHAWVEVYFDGIGWLTFDPTPSDSNGESAIKDSYSFLQAPVEQPDDQMPIDDLQTNDDNTLENNQQTQPLPDDESQVQQTPTQLQNKTITDKGNFVWLVISFIICLVLISVIVMAIAYINLRYKKQLSFNKSDNRLLAVRGAYISILRHLDLLNYRPHAGELPESFAHRVDKKIYTDLKLSDIIEILERAEYSDNEVSYDEAERVLNYLNELAIFANKRLNIFKKLYLKLTVKRKPRY